MTCLSVGLLRGNRYGVAPVIKPSVENSDYNCDSTRKNFDLFLLPIDGSRRGRSFRLLTALVGVSLRSNQSNKQSLWPRD